MEYYVNLIWTFFLLNKHCCVTRFILTYRIIYVKYSLRFILSKKKAHVSFPDVLIIITPIPYCSLCHRQYLRYLETKFTTASLAKHILLYCIHYIQDRVRSLCTLLLCCNRRNENSFFIRKWKHWYCFISAWFLHLNNCKYYEHYLLTLHINSILHLDACFFLEILSLLTSISFHK